MSRLPPDFTLLQVVPALSAGGVEQTAVDIAAAVEGAGGRSIVASEGGRLVKGLQGRHVLMPLASKNPLTMAANARRLKRLILQDHVDLVHVRSRAPAFSALAAARATGRPIVATYAGVYNAKGPLKRWYNGIMTRGDAVIANSNFTAAHLIAEHGSPGTKVVTIPRGIDLHRFDPGAVASERLSALRRAWGLAEGDVRPLVLLAGRLTRWKGQGFMLEAAGRLAAAGRRDFRLVIVGDDQGRGSYREALKAQIRGLDLEDVAVLAGHCEDMPAAWLLADIAAAPSLEPEAFGRTAVEPQAMGRPVLAADHGALTETVVPGETGWLVAPGDAEAWAAALAAALDAGPARLAAMGRAGMERARRLYSVEAMAASTLEVYAQLLERRA